MAQEQLALNVIKTILDCIKDAKEIPCGTIYAMLMEQGCTMEQYNSIEGILLRTKLVSKSNNLLTWQG